MNRDRGYAQLGQADAALSLGKGKVSINASV